MAQDDICWLCNITLQPDDNSLIFNDGNRICSKCDNKWQKIFYHYMKKFEVYKNE
jgi:hypothetical protein